MPTSTEEDARRSLRQPLFIVQCKLDSLLTAVSPAVLRAHLDKLQLALAKMAAAERDLCEHLDYESAHPDTVDALVDAGGAVAAAVEVASSVDLEATGAAGVKAAAAKAEVARQLWLVLLEHLVVDHTALESHQAEGGNTRLIIQCFDACWSAKASLARVNVFCNGRVRLKLREASEAFGRVLEQIGGLSEEHRELRRTCEELRAQVGGLCDERLQLLRTCAELRAQLDGLRDERLQLRRTCAELRAQAACVASGGRRLLAASLTVPRPRTIVDGESTADHRRRLAIECLVDRSISFIGRALGLFNEYFTDAETMRLMGHNVIGRSFIRGLRNDVDSAHER